LFSRQFLLQKLLSSFRTAAQSPASLRTQLYVIALQFSTFAHIRSAPRYSGFTKGPRQPRRSNRTSFFHLRTHAQGTARSISGTTQSLIGHFAQIARHRDQWQNSPISHFALSRFRRLPTIYSVARYRKRHYLFYFSFILSF